MPIVISEHAPLDLTLIQFTDHIDIDQIAALTRMLATRPDLARRDSIQVIDEDADLSSVKPEDLTPIRAQYRALQNELHPFLLRRSGWLCRSSAAWKLVEAWLDGRHSRDGQNTELCIASDWPQLSELFFPEEIAAAASADGFVEIVRIGD